MHVVRCCFIPAPHLERRGRCQVHAVCRAWEVVSLHVGGRFGGNDVIAVACCRATCAGVLVHNQLASLHYYYPFLFVLLTSFWDFLSWLFVSWNPQGHAERSVGHRCMFVGFFCGYSMYVLFCVDCETCEGCTRWARKFVTLRHCMINTHKALIFWRETDKQVCSHVEKCAMISTMPADFELFLSLFH